MVECLKTPVVKYRGFFDTKNNFMNKALVDIPLAKSIRPSDLMNYAINLNVKRVYTDVNGTIIAKAAALAAMQTKFPVFILGAFDFKGGYRKALESTPPQNGAVYLKTFIQGVETPASIIGFNIAADIQGQIKVGDMVSVYTDSFTAPTNYVWIIVSCNNASLGSIISNLSTTQKDDIYNRLYIEDVHYLIPATNQDQWNESIFRISVNNIGINNTDSFQPLIYKTPYTYLNNVLIMRVSFKATQFIGFSTYIQYASDEVQFILKVKK